MILLFFTAGEPQLPGSVDLSATPVGSVTLAESGDSLVLADSGVGSVELS